MELKQLEYFKATTDCNCNISKAAEKVYVSQPALSWSISKLEEELGCALFDRKKNRLHLNTAGIIVLAHVESVLAELEVMKRDLLRLSDASEPIRFASSAPGFMRLMLSKFYSANPDCLFKTEVISDEKIKDRFKNGLCDIAFTAQPIQDKGLANMPFGRTRLYCSVYESHPLASRECLTMEDLRGQNILYYETDNYMSEMIRNLCSEMDANVFGEGDTFMLNKKLESPEFISFVTSTYLHSSEVDKTRRFIPLLRDGAAVMITFYIVHNRHSSKTLDKFWDWSKTAYQDIMQALH